jgi:hypothetical protein
MSEILKSALGAEYLILSSAGSHAREDWRTIIERKTTDIANVQHTVWVLNSNAARPDIVQSLCKNLSARYVIFLARQRDAKPGSGPSTPDRVNLCSADNRSWSLLHPKLSHVTGKITRGTTGLWLNALEEVQSGSLSLTSFQKYPSGELLQRFEKHESTYTVRRAIHPQDGAYQILAVGQLGSPFAVWLKCQNGH